MGMSRSYENCGCFDYQVDMGIGGYISLLGEMARRQ